MSDDQFVKQTEEHLQRSMQNFSPDTLARLQSARLQAIEQGLKPKFWQLNRWLVPMGGLATVASVLLIAVLILRAPEAPQIPVEDDVLLIMAEADVLEEMEFILWLSDLEEDNEKT